MNKVIALTVRTNTLHLVQIVKTQVVNLNNRDHVDNNYPATLPTVILSGKARQGEGRVNHYKCSNSGARLLS